MKDVLGPPGRAGKTTDVNGVQCSSSLPGLQNLCGQAESNPTQISVRAYLGSLLVAGRTCPSSCLLCVCERDVPETTRCPGLWMFDKHTTARPGTDVSYRAGCLCSCQPSARRDQHAQQERTLLRLPVASWGALSRPELSLTSWFTTSNSCSRISTLLPGMQQYSTTQPWSHASLPGAGCRPACPSWRGTCLQSWETWQALGRPWRRRPQPYRSSAAALEQTVPSRPWCMWL